MSDKYDLDPEFEIVVAVACATSPRFYGTIGRLLEPDAFKNESAGLAVKASRAIAVDTSRPPSSRQVVLQRLNRWSAEGSVTKEQIDGVRDLFIDAPYPMPLETDICEEIAPVLKRRMQATAVRKAMEVYAKRGDFSDVAKIIHEAEGIGRRDSTAGTRLGSAAFHLIDKVKHAERMPTYIDDLDAVIGGGLPRGCQVVWIGASGSGKSMALSHQAAGAISDGRFVAVATLELNEATWFARVIANLTNEPIDKILNGDFEEAEEKVQALYPLLGTMLIREFAAKATTMRDIRAWIKDCEEQERMPVELLVIDYGDKLGSHNRKDENEYAAQGTVYEDMRLFAHETKKWVSTASQAKRSAGKDKKRVIGLDDVADSINKVRVADLVITINGQDELEYAVEKNRYGRAGVRVGPLPHDFACGAMVPRVE